MSGRESSLSCTSRFASRRNFHAAERQRRNGLAALHATAGWVVARDRPRLGREIDLAPASLAHLVRARRRQDKKFKGELADWFGIARTQPNDEPRHLRVGKCSVVVGVLSVSRQRVTDKFHRIVPRSDALRHAPNRARSQGAVPYRSARGLRIARPDAREHIEHVRCADLIYRLRTDEGEDMIAQCIDPRIDMLAVAHVPRPRSCTCGPPLRTSARAGAPRFLRAVCRYVHGCSAQTADQRTKMHTRQAVRRRSCSAMLPGGEVCDFTGWRRECRPRNIELESKFILPLGRPTIEPTILGSDAKGRRRML